MARKITPEEVQAREAAFLAPEAREKRRLAALKGAATKRLKRLARAEFICEAAHTTHHDDCAACVDAPVNMLEPCLEARLNVTPESLDEFMAANPLPYPTPYASTPLRNALLRNVSIGVIMRRSDEAVQERLHKMGSFLIKRQLDMLLNPFKYFGVHYVPEAVAKLEGLPFRDAPSES